MKFVAWATLGWAVSGALFLAVAFVIIQGFRMDDRCRSWGWQSGSFDRLCTGELDSGAKITKPFKEIEAQTCVGPYVSAKKTKTNPIPCPSNIHFSGSQPFFYKLKINGDVVTY